MKSRKVLEAIENQSHDHDDETTYKHRGQHVIYMHEKSSISEDRITVFANPHADLARME